MLQKERHRYILDQLNRHHKVLTNELCSDLSVSLDTIRRDLNELHREGRIVKVHGGAISKAFPLPFQQEKVYALEAKKEIAGKTLALVRDGMTILAGGGTIMIEVAKMLPENLNGIFFTVSPLVALEVAQRSSVNVVLIGGNLSRDAYICSGATVISQLAEIRADLCLLGSNALSTDTGLTEKDWEVCQVKKALIRSSSKLAVLSLAENLGKEQRLKVADVKAVDYLVTELGPEDERVTAVYSGMKVV